MFSSGEVDAGVLGPIPFQNIRPRVFNSVVQNHFRGFSYSLFEDFF